MSKTTGLTSSDYRTPDISYRNFHEYRTVGQIVRTGLIVPRTLIDIQQAGGTKTYLVLDDGKTLLDSMSGNQVPLSQIKGRMLITPTNPGKATAIKNLGSTMANKHYKGLIQSQTMFKFGDDITIGKFEQNVIDDIQYQLRKSIMNERQSLRGMEVDMSTITSKSITAVDFETSLIGKLGEKSKVVSAGVGRVVDYRFSLTPGEGMMPGTNEFGYTRAQGTALFDFEMVKSFNNEVGLIGKSNIGKGAKAAIGRIQHAGTGGMFGKKQVFEFYEGMWQSWVHNKNKQTQDLVTSGTLKPANAKFVSRGESLLDLFDQFQNGSLKETDFYTEFGRRANKVKNKLGTVISKFETLMENDVDYRVGAKSWSINKLMQRTRINIDGIAGSIPVSIEQGSEIQALKQMKITNNVLYGSAQDILESGKSAFQFTGTEQSHYENEIRLTDIEINEASKSKNTEASNALIKKKLVLSKVVTRLKDLQGIAKSITAGIMDEVGNTFSRSRTTAYEAIMNMGISRFTANEIIADMSDNIIRPAVKGTSLEDFAKLFKMKELGSTKHLGLGDVFTTANLGHELVNRFEYEKELIVSEITNKGPSDTLPKGAIYQIKKSGKDILDVSASYAKRLRALETVKLVTQYDRGDKVLTRKLLARVGVDTPEITRLLVPGTNRKNDVLSILSRGLEDEMTKVERASQHNSNIGTAIKSKFHANGSILGSLLSKRNVGMVVALKFSAYLDNFLQPGETDDHGSHASLETVARRISMTDFGSAWDKLGSSTFKLMKRVGQWAKRGTSGINELWKTEGSLLRAKEDLLIDIGNAPYKSFKVAKDSMDQRIGRLTPKLEKQSESIWTSLKGQSKGQRKLEQQVKQYLNDADMRTPYVHYKNQDEYSYFGMKNKIERHMSTLKTDRGYFFSGSDRLSTTMTQKEMRKSVVGGWRFDTYMRPPSPLMVEYSQVAPLKTNMQSFSKRAYYKELTSKQVSQSKLAKANINIDRYEEVLGVSSSNPNKLIRPIVNVKKAPKVALEASYPESKVLFNEAGHKPVAIRMPGERIQMKKEMYFPKGNNRLTQPSNINVTPSRYGRKAPPSPIPSSGPAKGFHTIPEPDTGNIISLAPPINVARPSGSSARNGGLSYHKDFSYMVNTNNKRNMYPGSKNMNGAGAAGTSAGLMDHAIYSASSF